MFDKRKQLAVAIFLTVIVIAFAGFSIYDLINKKDRYTVNINRCYELMEIENSINGLIPIGKDYYYLGYSDETSQAYVLKGSKGWYSKNFNSDGSSLVSGGITVTALLKRLDYKVARELSSVLSQADDINLAHSVDYSLELDYVITAVMRLLMIPLIIIVIVAGKIVFDENRGISTTIRKVYLLILCVVLFVALKFII